MKIDRTQENQEGFVLPAVLLALMVMSVIAVTAVRIGDDERRASRAMREVGAAFHAAEAGLTELRETVVDPATGETLVDSVAGTLDAGERADLGWTDLANGAQYRGELLRCDDGTNPLYALTVEGKGRSGRQSLRMMLRPSGGTNYALLVDGHLKLTSNPTIMGACADVHANGDFESGGTIITHGRITTSAAWIGRSGDIFDANGDPVVPDEGVDSVEVPLLNPMDFCGPADFVFRKGWIVESATLDSANAASGPVHGWTYKAKYKLYEAVGPVSPGTVCADQSLKVAVPQGIPGAPLRLSILAQGSIQISDEVYLAADHPDGVLFVARGDIKVSGGTEAPDVGYAGLIYAGSQCAFSSKQIIHGQIICKNLPDPPGVASIASNNQYTSKTDVEYDCTDYTGGGGGGGRLQPLGSRAWIEVL